MLPARPADGAKGAGIDRWEEGFDSWTPRRGAGTPDDTGVDLDRDALLRLARELAEKRRSEQEHAGAELERLKQSLRERAEAIAARERELAELQKRLGGGKPSRRNQPDTATTAEAIVARERAALQRAQALKAREREFQERAAGLERQAARIEQRERKLATELEQVQSHLDDSLSERELASAERAKLEERAEEARRVEKELAARRIELERERERLEARAREVEARTQGLGAIPADPDEPSTDPYERRESELRRLETTLEARERELALVRQSLDSERNELLERERALRRREAADVRQSFDEPLIAPSFSEGLAAFVSWRSSK
jgi:DNA repair exonuclease SbcCD ATPase subunit